MKPSDDKPSRMEAQLREAALFLQSVASMGGPLSGNAMEQARRCLVEADLASRSSVVKPENVCQEIADKYAQDARNAQTSDAQRMYEAKERAAIECGLAVSSSRSARVPLEVLDALAGLVNSKLVVEVYSGSMLDKQILLDRWAKAEAVLREYVSPRVKE